MNPYITFRDKDKEGNLQYYILQREFPHYIGLISEYPKAGNWYSAIAGHNLWVLFGGTLRGNMVPGYQNLEAGIQVIMDGMALWYLENRILPDEKRYKKFKITTNVLRPPQ